MAAHQRAAWTVAREALWTYRAESADEGEQDFFAALQAAVCEEIARRFSAAGRVAVGRELRLQVGSYAIRARLTNLEPVLADAMDASTRILAEHRGPEAALDISAFVSEVVHYPDERLGAAFDALVGLDDVKADARRKLASLLSPARIEAWARSAYGDEPPAGLLRTVRDRYPLLVLEGEVGSGKTALAYGIGHRLASEELDTPLALFVVNAQVRGGGHVGELTQNIARAFTEAERCSERERIPVLVLIDEADALAGARGGRHMHHEDNAGVNTLIQRIDRLRGRPLAVLFATNMAGSLDAAILRRAAAVYHFDRPTDDQRAQVFQSVLDRAGVSAEEVSELVALTRPRRLPAAGPDAVEHRYTFSDLVHRIVPHAVERAAETGRRLRIDDLLDACAAVRPTPERGAESSDGSPR